MFLLACIPLIMDAIQTYFQNRPFLNKIDTSMLSYPVKLNEIPNFENVNNLKINVMTIDNKFIVPLQLSKSKATRQVDLLYFNNHYFLIRNMERLLSKDGVKKKLFCLRCCQGFHSQLAHEKHVALCENHEAAKVRMPFYDSSTLKFQDYAKTMRAPFVAYFDFESILSKIFTTRPNPNQSYTNAQQKHDACYFFCMLSLIMMEMLLSVWSDALKMLLMILLFH